MKQSKMKAKGAAKVAGKSGGKFDNSQKYGSVMASDSTGAKSKGSAKSSYSNLPAKDGFHHMGTLMMSEDSDDEMSGKPAMSKKMSNYKAMDKGKKQ